MTRFLEYMPQKTKKCQAKTVRVPLHEKAVRILERYSGNTGKLLPFKPINTYNLGIRELLKHCGIDPMVTILDTQGDRKANPQRYSLSSGAELVRICPISGIRRSTSGHGSVMNFLITSNSR